MHSAFRSFEDEIDSASQLASLFAFVNQQIVSPFSFEDLLRAQLVYTMSAFDKLVHDLVRIGMVQSFMGARPLSPKYLAFQVSLKTHQDITSASIPPQEYYFEQAVFESMKHLSFQDPDKVTDALSLIWIEDHKWQNIAMLMGISIHTAKTTLRTIAGRRNSIVHESDIDPITHAKRSILQSDATNATDFIKRCGNAIYTLVK